MSLLVINYNDEKYQKYFYENKNASENVCGISIDYSNRKINCSHGNDSRWCYTHTHIKSSIQHCINGKNKSFQS